MNDQRFILVLFSLLASFCALGSEEVVYESLALKQMPREAQDSVEGAFKRFGLKRVFVGDKGSHSLGINMLFTDAFFVSKVALKYNIQGAFELNNIYSLKEMNVIHFKHAGVASALFFQNIADSTILQIKSLLLAQESSAFSFFPISTAHADECLKPLLLPGGEEFESKLYQGSTSSLLGECFNSIGDGAKESTFGQAKAAWNSLYGEYKKFVANPKTTMKRYGEYLNSGLEKIWDFSKTVSNMILEPQEGARIMLKKYGEVGQFFVGAYHNISNMPLSQKVDVMCNMIGALGVEALLAAITAGATGAKMAFTASRLLLKLNKVSSLIGKGLKYSFKSLSRLTEDAIARFEKIIASGNVSMLERRLREVDCAL